jgi:hypothetical protein
LRTRKIQLRKRRPNAFKILFARYVINRIDEYLSVGNSFQELPCRLEGINRLKIQVEGVIQDVEGKIGVAAELFDITKHAFKGG